MDWSGVEQNRVEWSRLRWIEMNWIRLNTNRFGEIGLLAHKSSSLHTAQGNEEGRRKLSYTELLTERYWSRDNRLLD